MCDIDFSDDNGYGYILDELKATRNRIDNIIKLLESRMEKDNVIDEILNTDYLNDVSQNNDDNLSCDCDDTCQDKNTNTAVDIDTLIKIMALEKFLDNKQYSKTPRYPFYTYF